MDALSLQALPLGFRFRPTDEELINHYLKGKINGHLPEFEIIPEIDVCKCEPWDLPDKSVIKSDDKEWFFFAPRDRKYPNGHRSNRATEAGYWKATGKDRTIKSRTPSGTALIGMKKTLVFHRGRAPKGERTHWIMHEYRTTENDDEGAAGGDQGAYVLYRLFRKPEETIIISNLDEPEESGFFNTPPKSSPVDAKYSSGPAEEFESKAKHHASPEVEQEDLQVMPYSNKNELGDDLSLTYKQGPGNLPVRSDDSDTNLHFAVENCELESPNLLRDGLLDAIVDPYKNLRTDPPILFGGIQNSEEYGCHLESGGATEKDPIADFLDSVLSNHSEYPSYVLNNHESVATDLLQENGAHNSVDGISCRSLDRSNEPTDLSRDMDLLQWENFERVEGPYRETPLTYMQGLSTDTMHDNLASNYHLACLDQPFGPGMISVNGASVESPNDLAWGETAVRVMNEEPSHSLEHARNMGQGTAARRIRLTRRIKLRPRSSGLVEQHSKQYSASDTNKPSHIKLIAHTVQEQQQNLCCSKILHEDDNLVKMPQNKEHPDLDHSDMPDNSADGLTEKARSNIRKIKDQNEKDPAELLSKQLNGVVRLDQINPSADQSEPSLRMREGNNVSDALTRHHCLLEDGEGRSRRVRLTLWVMSVGVLALAVGMIYLQGHKCA